MTDYHDSTNEQLQQYIGELLGWKNIELNSYWLEDFYDIREVCCLFGISPDSRDRVPLPDWTHDEGAALLECQRLAAERQYRFWLVYHHSEHSRLNETGPYWSAEFEAWFSASNMLETVAIAVADDPARVLAELLAAALEMQP